MRNQHVNEFRNATSIKIASVLTETLNKQNFTNHDAYGHRYYYDWRKN